MLCDTAGVGGEGVLHLSTGSPFGHHPRLSMGCPRRGQWMSAQKYSVYYRPHVSYIVLRILSTHCITYHSLRIPYMVLKTLSLIASPNSVSVYRIWSCRYSHSTPTLSSLLSHPHRAASGGGAPCLTAGDTRAERGGTRGKVDSTNLRRRRRRTESVEKVSFISPPRKKLIFVVTEALNKVTNRRL